MKPTQPCDDKEIRPTKEGKWPKVVKYKVIFFGPVALGNSTTYRVGVCQLKDRILVSVVGRGCYPFSHFAHYSYVQEKLGIQHEGDARNLADFINTQLDCFDEPQGYYHPHLCLDEDDIYG